MSRICDICGKKRMSGKTVSHAENKSNRTFEVNLHKTEINGKSVKACTKCMKTARKTAK